MKYDRKLWELWNPLMLRSDDKSKSKNCMYLGELKNDNNLPNAPHYRKFVNIVWGFRAGFVEMFHVMWIKSLNTISGLARYWFVDDDERIEWVEYVSGISGIPEYEPIDVRDQIAMLLLMSAIVRYHFGKTNDPQSHYMIWRCMYDAYKGVVNSQEIVSKMTGISIEE